MVGLKNIIVVILLLIGTTALGQKAENGFKDIITSDTTLNKFMVYWLRKPYKFGGNSEKGIDCSKLTKRLYKDVYNKIIGDIAEEQFDQSKRIKRDSLQLGDLVFFRSKQSPSGWHCGAYIGNTYFIHAANRYEGVKISSLDEPRYKKTIRGFGRFEDNKL
jgi:lipoprotein Spr